MPNKIPKSRILVFIPTFNCSEQIARVLGQFDSTLQEKVTTLIVIDNCSLDATLERAISAASKFQACEFIVWRNDQNYGLGGSHKSAFEFGIKNSYDYLVVLHGDDQADINDAATFLDHLNSMPPNEVSTDCWLGARFKSGSHLYGYSPLRALGNRVYNLLFSTVLGHRIYDLGSGLNIYRLSALQKLDWKNLPDDLTFNYALLLKSYSAGLKIDYFPISWREVDQISNVKLFRQSFRVLKILAFFTFQKNVFLRKDWRSKVHESYSGEILLRNPSQSP